MEVSVTLRAAISPTKSCICQMNSTKKTQLMTKNIAVDRKKKQRNCKCNLYATPEQGSDIPDIPITLQSNIQHEPRLQQEVMKIKRIMVNKSSEENQIEELIMVDAIQRLGLDCYFRDHIHDVLERHHMQCITKVEGGDSLHHVALRFRLLRQAGYYISADVFNRFKDNDKFRKEIHTDIKGLMNLFEASQLAIPGDHHTLDDACEFCKIILESTLKNARPQSDANLIRKTLENPYHKSLPRLATKNEIETLEITLKVLHDYCGMKDWIRAVQHLAIIDASTAQIAHQNEINKISRWWKELGLTKKLKRARNQPVKWHMWSLVVLPDPNMAELRTELTKAISFIYLIDDIFDVYGTLEELTLFTEAVNRWDCNNIEELPDYMIMCLNALYDTTNDISNKIYIKHGWNPKDCLKKAWADLCKAFLVEARWFTLGQLPTAEEYLKNGAISSGVFIVSANVFSLLGEAMNSRSTDLLNGHPEIVSSTATILRLWDDLGSSKDENQDGNDGSYITYYMNQYKDSSPKSARECVFRMISNAWKCLNQECLSHSPFSAEYKTALLNLARMVPIMYSYDENNRLPNLEKHMKLLHHE